jgi:hypothetical protein
MHHILPFQTRKKMHGPMTTSIPFPISEKKKREMICFDYAMRNFAFPLSLLINPSRKPFVETV